MERAESGRAGGSRQGRVQRRPPTWEISDSDSEGPAGVEAAVRVPDSADERRAAAETPRRLRPEQALRRLAVLVDPGAGGRREWPGVGSLEVPLNPRRLSSARLQPSWKMLVRIS